MQVKKPMKQTNVKIHVKYSKYVVFLILKLSRIVNFNTYFNKIPWTIAHEGYQNNTTKGTSNYYPQNI